MKKQKLPTPGLPVKAFLSLFGIGFVPVAPGTVASIVTAAFLVAGVMHFPVPIFWWAMVPAVVAGLMAVSFMFIAKFTKPKDADQEWIVMDEVIGMLIAATPALLFPALFVPMLFTAFVWFRFFDIFKPLGINHVDDRPGAAAVLLDDVLAGFYAAAITMGMWVLLTL